MKAIKIVNQEQLEQKAIDSMIAYEHGSISKREMHLAITRAPVSIHISEPTRPY